MDPGASGQSSAFVGDATVAVHEAPTLSDASEVAALLSEAGVPAELEPAGHAVEHEPWFVVVPWSRQRDADVVLEDQNVPVLPRFRVGATFDLRAERARRLEEAEEEQKPPLELPDSGPLLPRLLFALTAIAIGVGLQRGLALWLGDQAATNALAASSTHAGEWWRLVTAGFAHFGPAHLFSNAAFGLLLGVVLSGTHGPGAVMLVWLMSSVLGIGAQLLGSPESTWVAGASAGNYGLVGLWTMGQLERARLELLPRRERMRTFGVLLLLLPGALTPVTGTGARVAVVAHAAGFFAGALAGWLFERRLLPGRFDLVERRSRYAQWAALFIVATAFMFAIRASLA